MGRARAKTHRKRWHHRVPDGKTGGAKQAVPMVDFLGITKKSVHFFFLECTTCDTIVAYSANLYSTIVQCSKFTAPRRIYYPSVAVMLPNKPQ